MCSCESYHTTHFSEPFKVFANKFACQKKNEAFLSDLAASCFDQKKYGSSHCHDVTGRVRWSGESLLGMQLVPHDGRTNLIFI